MKWGRPGTVPPCRAALLFGRTRSSVITPDTALRISALIGTTPQFWLNLQQAVDLWDAAHSTETRRALKKIARVKQTA